VELHEDSGEDGGGVRTGGCKEEPRAVPTKGIFCKGLPYRACEPTTSSYS
jgi:hypothetical protein